MAAALENLRLPFRLPPVDQPDSPARWFYNQKLIHPISFLAAALTYFEGYKPRQQRCRIKLTDDAFDIAQASRNRMHRNNVAISRRRSNVIPLNASGNANPTNMNIVPNASAISRYSRIIPIIRWYVTRPRLNTGYATTAPSVTAMTSQATVNKKTLYGHGG